MTNGSDRIGSTLPVENGAIPAAGDSQEQALLHNLLLFGRVLHGLGMEASPGRMIEVQAALGHVGIGFRADFYYTLRGFLVKRRDDLALFDQAFDLFWRKPPDEAAAIDLSQMLDLSENRTQRGDAAILPPEPSVDESRPELEDNDEESLEVVELTLTYSRRERLRRKDFADLTPAEFMAIRRMIADLIWQLGQRRTRRSVPGRDGLLDVRRSLRRNLRHGGELLRWSHRMPKVKPRPLVVIADISGSMERYARLLLHFMYSMTHGVRQRVEIFVFGTRLTRITRQLRNKQVDRALAEVAGTVKDWSGGTRIGDAIKSFNRDWSGRALAGGAVVLLISDGWDRGDPLLLDQEMARLHRLCNRLIWLNPLLGHAQYEPLTRGMQAALPHIDDFLPVHNLASLEDLARHLGRLDERRASQRRSFQLQGAAFVGRR